MDMYTEPGIWLYYMNMYYKYNERLLLFNPHAEPKGGSDGVQPKIDADHVQRADPL